MLFKKSVMTAAVFAVGSFAVMSANATSPKSGAFDVNLTVTANCLVTASSGAQDINFNSLNADNTSKTAFAATPIKVACSDTTPYKIALSPTKVGTTGAGEMTGTTGDIVPYQLSDAEGTAWGNVIGTGANVQSGKGTGTDNEFSHVVHVTVANTNVKPGIYKDTVAVQVTY